jgi:hypothetical protein
MPKPGTVFQPLGDGYHFWVVISKERKGHVLVVNVTDVKHAPDSPCILQPGDHPNITKPSAVRYKDAQAFSAMNIDQQIVDGSYIRQLPDCSPQVLQRIIAGAKKADDLTLKLLNYL